MEWLGFLAGAFFGLLAGAILGNHMQDHFAKVFAGKVWREIIAKRLQTERVLHEAEQVIELQKKGRWDYGERT